MPGRGPAGSRAAARASRARGLSVFLSAPMFMPRERQGSLAAAAVRVTLQLLLPAVAVGVALVDPVDVAAVAVLVPVVGGAGDASGRGGGNLAARRRAFAVPATKQGVAALTATCTQDYDVVNVACGQAAAGLFVPSQCTAWCQLVYLQWWPRCQHVRVFATIEKVSSLALSGFYRTCQAANRPTCSPCRGSAKGSDELSVDSRVLSAGSAHAAAFRIAWRGQLANLLCLGPAQVAVTAITAAAGRPVPAAGGHRLLSGAGTAVNVEVTWTLAASSNAQARRLVHAVMEIGGMGWRQLRRTGRGGSSACVVGKNVGPLVKAATAVVPCVDKADSGFAGQACAIAIAHLKQGCADSLWASTFSKNCPKSCGACGRGGEPSRPNRVHSHPAAPPGCPTLSARTRSTGCSASAMLAH